MPYSAASTYSLDRKSSISGVSGNYGGAPYRKGMDKKELGTWLVNRYPAMPSESEYVSSYKEPDHYRKGTQEHKDYEKYATICGQAKRYTKEYEDLRELDRPAGCKDYNRKTYRTEMSGISQAGSLFDPHERLIRPVEIARDAWERSARNRDKFDQKHPNVLWTVASKQGHRHQAASEYRSSLDCEKERYHHDYYRYGGQQDQDQVKWTVLRAAKASRGST